MKVLIVNTSETRGGAAVAARRLMHALKLSGIGVKMLVRDKQTRSASVVAVRESVANIARFAWERLRIFIANGLNRRDLFAVSVANTGVDITQLPEFKEADIIHLHRFNQGFLSHVGLGKILPSGLL